MKSFSHNVDRSTVAIMFPESHADLVGFERFLADPSNRVLAIDTETTGLDVFSPGHGLRLVQIGNGSEAWVLRADLFRPWIVRALESSRHFVCHNAPYDLQVIDRHLGVRLESLGPKTFDTRVLAHLLDPRTRSEGGTGLGLKDLATVYVDSEAVDPQTSLHAVFRSEYRATKVTGWAKIDIDHPDYVRYAGLDVVYTHRLFRELAPMVNGAGLDGLSEFEHGLQILVALMERRGMLLDVAYTRGLVEDLAAEAESFRNVAARYGVENVNSTAQVAAALAAMGESLTERTPSGAVKVDKAVLTGLADVELRTWGRVGAREPNPLADAVLRVKRAEKWSVAYAQAFLDLRDGADRVHPRIGTLQARTARMSVSNPPLQQLPSGEWRIRRAFLADPGHRIISTDYAQIEMRVLAALAHEETMIEAIKSGVDLHDFTARRIWGEGFTKAQRGLAKGVGFGKVYGGGAATLSRQTGAPIDLVREAVRAYDETFPGIRRFGGLLQRRAELGKKEVVTPSGRHLPLDRDRLYAATNYVVQSTARDVLAQAIVGLHDAGLGDYLLLPIHDEILAQAPEREAEEVASEIARVMSRDFYGVPCPAEAEIGGRSWGSLYGASE